jgi:hypothetical protein
MRSAVVALRPLTGKGCKYQAVGADAEWSAVRPVSVKVERQLLALSRCESSIGSVRQVSKVLRTNVVFDGG